jgi:hypothetical protein
MLRRAHLLLGVTTALGFLPLACGSKKPADSASLSLSASAGGSSAQPSSSALPATSSSVAAPSASASSSAPPLASVYTTDPNQIAALIAAAAAAGSAMMQNGGLGGDPAEAGLRAAITKHAPAMSPEGQMAKGTLQEGGHSQFLMTLMPGKCYTIVGFSPAGQIKDLDLNLLAPPFFTMLAGQDGMNDNTAVLGKAPQPMCPFIPFAVAYKVDIFAKKGSGAFAVQALSKNK